MYLQDWDETFPTQGVLYSNLGNKDGSCMWFLQPYVKNTSVFQCPSAPMRYKNNNPFTDFYGTHYGLPAAYRYSDSWGGTIYNYGPTEYRGLTLADIPDTSRQVLMADSRRADSSYETYGRGYHLIGKVDTSTALCLRHSEGFNAAFVDGHVKWFDEAQRASANTTGSPLIAYWLKTVK